MNDEDNKVLEEKTIDDQNLTDKKFEDLDPEEMEKVQGSGDMKPEAVTNIFTALLSNCGLSC